MLEYDASPECPNASAFDAEVAKRAPHARTTGARVAIRASASEGYDGRLTLDGATRDVHADTCAETVQALALAVAMAAMDDTNET